MLCLHDELLSLLFLPSIPVQALTLQRAFVIYTISDDAELSFTDTSTPCFCLYCNLPLHKELVIISKTTYNLI